MHTFPFWKYLPGEIKQSVSAPVPSRGWSVLSTNVRQVYEKTAVRTAVVLAGKMYPTGQFNKDAAFVQCALTIFYTFSSLSGMSFILETSNCTPT